MFLRLHVPAPPLGHLVESIMFYSGLDTPHRRERLIPDGTAHLCVDLTDTPKRRWADPDPAHYLEFRKGWVSGVHDRWMDIEAQLGSSMLVMAFRPGGLHPIVTMQAAALSNLVVPLDDVFGPRAWSLRDRVLEASGVDAKIKAAEDWLLECCGTVPVLDPVVSHVAMAAGRRGRWSAADIAEETGYTERHISGLFSRWVGVSPKSLQRLRRFARVREDLLAPSTRRSSWADLAACHGYSDQSHLIRDFRQFAGLSPRNYASAADGIDNYLPVPEG